VGVAIATALMPPLATVGFGLATGNSAIAWGALALFATNFVTIALSGTIMARLYGFGHYLSTHQTWLQTGLLLGAFVAMAVPLGLSLEHIASQAVTTNQIHAALVEASGREARITQLDIDFQAVPIAVRTVIITPRQKAVSTARLAEAVKARTGKAVALQADQVWRAPSSSGLDDAKAALARAQDLQVEQQQTEHIRIMLAIAAGAAPDDVLIDREAHRAQVAAVLLPGADLSTYRALEQRIAAAADGWTVTLTPPAGLSLLPVPVTGNGQLSSAAMAAVETNIWLPNAGIGPHWAYRAGLPPCLRILQRFKPRPRRLATLRPRRASRLLRAAHIMRAFCNLPRSNLTLRQREPNAMHGMDSLTLGLLLLIACLVAIICRLGQPYAIGLVVAGIGLSVSGYKSGISLTPNWCSVCCCPWCLKRRYIWAGQFRREGAGAQPGVWRYIAVRRCGGCGHALAGSLGLARFFAVWKLDCCNRPGLGDRHDERAEGR
jgi:hypothetical protein